MAEIDVSFFIVLRHYKIDYNKQMLSWQMLNIVPKL